MDQAVKNMLDLYGVTSKKERFLLSEQSMFINGEFVVAGGKETIDVVEPSTASYLASVPSGTTRDVDRAVSSGPLATSIPICIPSLRAIPERLSS